MIHCLLLAVLILLFASPAGAYNIRDINVNIDIQPDSSMIVTETIIADFSTDPHHGIFRFIPMTATDKYGHDRGIHLELQGVTDENGTPLEYHTSSEDGNFHMKVGNPEILVNDTRTYRLKYKVCQAVHFYEDHEELYGMPSDTNGSLRLRNPNAPCICRLM